MWDASLKPDEHPVPQLPFTQWVLHACLSELLHWVTANASFLLFKRNFIEGH